jgi:hypothetical protein
MCLVSSWSLMGSDELFVGHICERTRPRYDITSHDVDSHEIDHVLEVLHHHFFFIQSDSNPLAQEVHVILFLVNYRCGYLELNRPKIYLNNDGAIGVE